jgi:GT2 family glycosyltransferase
VVIPTRNTRELTLCCLASLAGAVAARGAGVETIMVDDAGSDGTAEAVEAGFPGVRVLRLAEASGFTRAANQGLALTRGEVLLLLNSDTEVERAGLEALLTRFAADPRLGVAGAVLRYPDGSAQWSGGGEPTLAWLLALASGLPRWIGGRSWYRRLRPVSAASGAARPAWVTGAAMAMRRAVWQAVGPLDERFRFYAQDLDFCLRAGAAGWRIAVLSDFRVLHHHGASIREATRAEPWQDPRLLWTDLVRWADKHRGARWARRAALALQLGGSLRLFALRLAALGVAAPRRTRYRSETVALCDALAALRAQTGELA